MLEKEFFYLHKPVACGQGMQVMRYMTKFLEIA